ncbi:MAG: hypothetical protein ABJC13_06180 [Acidobacteriota bacterium]
MKKICWALALAAALSPSASWALSPYLVADLDPGFFSAGSQPYGFVSLGSRVVFQILEKPVLWGTAGVLDDPVPLGPPNLRVDTAPVAAGGRGYFNGCDGSDCGFYATDGTPAGTRRLLRFRFASFFTPEAVAPAGLPRTLVILSAENGPTLWRTDGTPAGTRKVGAPARARRLRELTEFRGKGWFFADLPNAPGALLSSDGLAAGTRRIGTSTLGSGFTTLGGRLLFYADQGIWASDGTAAGTGRLAALPGLDPSFRPPIVAAGGRAFFFYLGGGERELWTTDGTPEGTRRVKAVAGDGRNDLRALGAKVGFVGFDAARGAELWTSDGTAAGTRQAKDLCPGPCSGVSELGPSALGKIWLAGTTPDRGLEVWTSDLSPAGTRQLRDLCAGACSSDPRQWRAAGGRMYFLARVDFVERLIASDGTAAGTLAVGVPARAARTLDAVPLGAALVFVGYGAAQGEEPWISDGTAAGTRLLADLDSANLAGSYPLSYAEAGGRPFFFAFDGILTTWLWTTDGTAEGTRVAYELPDELCLEEIGRTAEAGGRLVAFLEMCEEDRLFEVVGSDGTPAGSGPLLPAGVFGDGRFVPAGGQVLFSAFDEVHGFELWSTDGTPGGTTRLSDFVLPDPFRPEGAGFPMFFSFGDRAVVPVLSVAGGEELWISDGTAAGTRPLHEVFPFLEAPLENAKSATAALDGRFYFVAAAPGDAAATLWSTDLSASGTRSVGPLDLSRAEAGGWSLFPLGVKLLLSGSSTTLGQTLWTSDGTAAGTRLVGAQPISSLLAPVAFSNRLWFQNEFGELWSTDGTTEGTKIFEIDGGPLFPLALAPFAGRLILSSRQGFFASDGTAAGTVRIDLPGPAGPYPGSLLPVGDRLYFRWDDLVHGAEPWALRPD